VAVAASNQEVAESDDQIIGADAQVQADCALGLKPTPNLPSEPFALFRSLLHSTFSKIGGHQPNNVKDWDNQIRLDKSELRYLFECLT